MNRSPAERAKQLRVMLKSWQAAANYAQAMVDWHEVPENKAVWARVREICEQRIAEGGK